MEGMKRLSVPVKETILVELKRMANAKGMKLYALHNKILEDYLLTQQND